MHGQEPPKTETTTTERERAARSSTDMEGTELYETDGGSSGKASRIKGAYRNPAEEE